MLRQCIVDTHLTVAYSNCVETEDDTSNSLNGIYASQIKFGEDVLREHTKKAPNKDAELNALWMQVLEELGLEPNLYPKGLDVKKGDRKLQKKLELLLESEGQ